MTYHHPSYTASHKHDSASYALATAGDAAATADYMTKADLPGYTARFYSPSEQEQFADVKYDKLLINYDKDFEEIREAVKGMPLEAYIPRSLVVAESGGSAAVPVVVKKSPAQEVVREIEKAQKEVKGQITIIDTVVDELLIVRRRTKKRKIIVHKE